jgi:hypothetical protein
MRNEKKQDKTRRTPRRYIIDILVPKLDILVPARVMSGSLVWRGVFSGVLVSSTK